MLVIPATQEAKVEESLEPERWRLQGAEIAPLHCSLGSKSETQSQKKKLLIKKSLFTMKIKIKHVGNCELERRSGRSHLRSGV